MADSKISALPASTVPLAGTEVLPIVQSGVTKQVAVSDLTAGRAISASSITNSGLTVNRVVYAGTGGLLSTNANLTYNTAVLQVGGTAPQFNVSVTSGVQDTYVYFNNTNAYNYMYFQTSGVTFGKFLAANGTGMLADFNNFVWRSNAGAEYSRIDTSGNYVPAVAAKGINFTANTPLAGMTSQLLNWYEEGTWTPTFSNLTVVLGAGSVAYTGRYTRIGRVVQCSWQIAPTGGATTASTANLTTITNLPFSITSSGAFPYPVSDNSVSNIGPGVFYSGTLAYTPTWSARTGVMVGSGTFIV